MIEQRNTIIGESRAVKQDDKNFIEGYAALYNVRSLPLEWGFIEVIEPEAFSRADISDVSMLNNHNSNQLLARTKNGTLSVTPDAKGLFYRGEVADTSYGKDLLALIQRGDVDQSSFAFEVAPNGDEWTVDDDGFMIRHIKKFLRISDVSPTPYPAYVKTSVDKRSYEKFQKTISDLSGLQYTRYLMRMRYLESLG